MPNRVKSYMDNFERLLLLLFEQDIVTGQATDHRLCKHCNLESLPEEYD